jgi:hypothetical protein
VGFSVFFYACSQRFACNRPKGEPLLSLINAGFVAVESLLCSGFLSCFAY